MIDNNTTNPPERVRVSIFERIVPFASLALAAIASGVGGWRIISMMTEIRETENMVGVITVAAGLLEETVFPLIFFYAAAALGVIAICVALGRLVVETKTASPSGISYLVLGILSLVPAVLVWQSGAMIVSVLDSSSRENLGELGTTITAYCTIAMIAAPIILMILLAWSLIPFKSRPGRRFGPIICLILVEIMLIAAAVAFQLRIMELNEIWRLQEIKETTTSGR